MIGMVKQKTFLKWAGGKYRCLEQVFSALPVGTRLIEPFTGSGVVFLNAHYSHYVLGENNLDLVELYHHIQREGEPFIDFCASFFCPTNNSPEPYYTLRTAFNTCTDPRRRAALFLYLNRHGYNGLCRYNRRGGYNVPFGHYKKPYFPHKELHLFHQKSQHATIVHADFRETMANAVPGDVIYCDPPYAPLSQRSNFSSYTHQPFGEAEQIALAELAITSANRGIPVIISNHDTDFTRHHYRQSQIQSFPVRRSISCNTAQRINVNELIAVFK
jgi:DNA adenine methylase